MRGLFPLAGNAAELLARCDFPPPGEPLDCAVSGGPDSLGLLVLAAAAGCQVTAWHVDHGLREGSAGEAEVVRGAAERLGARFEGLKVEVGAGPNVEARARAARLSVLPHLAATGHTADDQAETVLLNLMRGSGLDGLSAMRPGRHHPILRLRRTEVRHLVETVGLEPVCDPTNADPAIRRNAVRRDLVPLAARIFSRDVVPILARQAAMLKDDADLLNELAAAIDPCEAAALAAAPAALSRRAVRHWLRDPSGEGYPPSAASVERVLAVARGEVLACEIEGGRRVSRSKGRLSVSGPVETHPEL